MPEDSGRARWFRRRGRFREKSVNKRPSADLYHGSDAEAEVETEAEAVPSSVTESLKLWVLRTTFGNDKSYLCTMVASSGKMVPKLLCGFGPKVDHKACVVKLLHTIGAKGPPYTYESEHTTYEGLKQHLLTLRNDML